MTEPLISIIVPVYRVESYLSRCVDSLLAQTYQNLEIILVDDGSPDQCPQICEDYAKKEERIHVIHQENRGLSGARNAGIDVATGEYLAFVDSDDYVSRHDYIRGYCMMLSAGHRLRHRPVPFFLCERETELVEEPWIRCVLAFTAAESLMEKLYGPEEEATWFVVAWNKLYRGGSLQRDRNPLSGRTESTRMRRPPIGLFDEAKKLAFVDRVLYGYFTENGGSITAVFSSKTAAVAGRLMRNGLAFFNETWL